MTKPISSRRQRVYVDSEVQGSLLRRLVLHWVVLLSANSLALLIWLRLFERPEGAWDQTAGECFQRYLPFLVISIALLPAFLRDTLKLTNRFAGPALRFRRALSAAAAGMPVEPLSFRKDDFWQQMADDFNRLLHRQQELEQQLRRAERLEPVVHD